MGAPYTWVRLILGWLRQLFQGSQTAKIVGFVCWPPSTFTVPCVEWIQQFVLLGPPSVKILTPGSAPVWEKNGADSANEDNCGASDLPWFLLQLVQRSAVFLRHLQTSMFFLYVVQISFCFCFEDVETARLVCESFGFLVRTSIACVWSIKAFSLNKTIALHPSSWSLDSRTLATLQPLLHPLLLESHC